jgi:hypothetical protein
MQLRTSLLLVCYCLPGCAKRPRNRYRQVSDSAGAVMPYAAVTATNTETGVQSTVTTRPATSQSPRCRSALLTWRLK